MQPKHHDSPHKSDSKTHVHDRAGSPRMNRSISSPSRMDRRTSSPFPNVTPDLGAWPSPRREESRVQGGRDLLRTLAEVHCLYGEVSGEASILTSVLEAIVTTCKSKYLMLGKDSF